MECVFPHCSVKTGLAVSLVCQVLLLNLPCIFIYFTPLLYYELLFVSLFLTTRTSMRLENGIFLCIILSAGVEKNVDFDRPLWDSESRLVPAQVFYFYHYSQPHLIE